MSVPKARSIAPPEVVIARRVDGSAVVSTIGTSWKKLSPLPGCSPMRCICARMYSTVRSSPAEPGPRPSNSSEARVRTRSAKSAPVIAGSNAWSEAGAGTGATASGLAAASSSCRPQPASRSAPTATPIRGLRNIGTPRGQRKPDSRASVPGLPARRARSVLRRGVGVEHHRVGAGDRTGAGTAAHVQAHLALELQRALDHRARADHHPRLALGRGLEPAAAALDAEAAGHHRADADGDVAVDRLDVAAQLGLDQPDGAVDGLDVAGHGAAAVDEHAAVDGLDAAGGLHVAADADRAVDRVQAADAGVGADLDAAVDGAGVAGLGAVADADAAVDGVQLTVDGAGGDLDAAVDLADVVGRPGRGHGQQQAEGDGGEAGLGHGGPPFTSVRAMGPRLATIRTCLKSLDLPGVPHPRERRQAPGPGPQRSR